MTRSLAELITEAFDWTFKTNLSARLRVVKAAMPHLRAGASIINTASVQAYDPSEDLLDYAPVAPLGRPGHPAELGPLYVLLASQESSYATGQVLGESGGRGNQ